MYKSRESNDNELKASQSVSFTPLKSRISDRARRNLGTFSTTTMDEVAHQLFQQHVHINGVDICAYPELVAMETVCKNFIYEMFHASQTDHRCFPTSGSSEAILMALVFIKNHAVGRSKTGVKPNFIIGTNAHSSWKKALQYLDVELKEAEVTSGHVIDVTQVSKLVDENTIGLGCTLGITTALAFDPIEAIHHQLVAYYEKTGHFIPMHIDAAGGGFVAPFQYPELNWDFRLKHVVSINVSSHKFGMVYPSLGWLCIRDDYTSDQLSHENHYLGKPMKRFPISFSHSGAPMVAQSYYVEHYGFEGYKKAISELYELTTYFKGLLSSLPLIHVISPDTISCLPGLVFTVKSDPAFSIEGLAESLLSKGWHLPTFQVPYPDPYKTAARILIRRGYDKKLLDELLGDIKRYFKVD